MWVIDTILDIRIILLLLKPRQDANQTYLDASDIAFQLLTRKSELFSLLVIRLRRSKFRVAV